MNYIIPIPPQANVIILLDLDQRGDSLSYLQKHVPNVAIYGFAGPYLQLPKANNINIIQTARTRKEAADYEMMLHVSSWLALGELEKRKVVLVTEDKGLANVVEILRERGIQAELIVNAKRLINASS